MLKYLLLLICFLTLLNCQPTPLVSNESSRAQMVATEASVYFATFAEREDWEKLLSFYREDLIFEDVLLQLHLDSLWQFERFYNWPDTAFRKLYPEQKHLNIHNLVANDSVAVAQGVLNPFYYYGKRVDTDWGMNFTIWLYFDKGLKIYKQIDWFEYNPTVMQSVLDRYHKEGVDKIPDWLDLSR